MAEPAWRQRVAPAAAESAPVEPAWRRQAAAQAQPAAPVAPARVEPGAPMQGPPTIQDVVTRIRALPDYAELMRVGDLAQRATFDPSVGDRNAYLDRAEELTEQILSQVTIDRATFNELVRFDMSGRVEVPEALKFVGQQGANVFGAVSGALDFINFFGTGARTFTANLADVQGERVAREQGLPVGERIDPSVGTFQGEPAKDPITAVIEMSKAAWRTSQDLNLTDEPLLARDEEGKLGFNPESGWVVFAPDLVWGTHRIGISSYEANLGVSGRDLNERFKIAERLGVEDERGKELLGLGTELLLDPLMAADWFFVTGKIANTLGKVTKTDALINTGVAFERFGTNLYQALSPTGAARTVLDYAKLEPTGVVKATEGAVTRGVNAAINGILDMPAPLAELWTSRQTRAAAGVMGWEEGKLPAPKIRDLFFQGGRVEPLSSGNPLEALSGSERFGLSAGELAIGTQRIIQTIAARGAKTINDILTDGLKIQGRYRLPGAKIFVPKASMLRPEDAAFVRTLGTIVSDFVSSTGVLPKGRIPKEVSRQLRAAAELHGRPLDDVVNRFRGAVTAARNVSLETGYEVSGYRYFVQAIQGVAAKYGVDYGDLRRAYEKFVGNVDLQTLELQDTFTFGRAAETGATPATSTSRRTAKNIIDQWAIDPESFMRFEQDIQEELVRLGRNDLAGIPPSSYLQGIRNGYLPRMFQMVEDPAAAFNALNDRSVITVRKVDPKDLGKRFGQSLGKDTSQAVRQFFTARRSAVPGDIGGEASYVFRADDLATMLTEKTGRTVTPEQVSDIIYADSDNYKFLQETLGLLRGPAGTAPRAGAGGAPWAMTPSAFKSRQDFDAEDLARRVLIQDPVAQVAEIGLRGGRQVRAQSFIANIHDELERMNLILPESAIPGVSPAGAERIFPFQQNGERWVVLPKANSVWGPLAGKAIPEDIARQIVYASSFGQTSNSTVERLLGMWRRQLLSPLSTSLRNVVSTSLLIQRAGGDLSDMLTKMPRAAKIRREFLETRRLPEEFRGYENLIATFTQDSTLSATALRAMEDQLEMIAQGGISGSERLNSLLDNTEALVDAVTQSPVAAVLTLGGTGALGAFRWGEEVTRMSAFLSTYDTLLRNGLDADTAIRRAAHFAQNAAFNYGASPLLPDALRRSGLSAFPQFSWFAIPRQIRTAMERPGVLARVEYARRGANIALQPDMDEQERATAMTSDWLRYSSPLMIPIPGKDGEYYIVNLKYWLPDGDLQALLADPLQAGAFSMFIDAAIAWASGSGVGPFGARFGIQTFDPAEETGGRILQTAQSLGTQTFVPGVFRQAEAITEAVRYNDDPELFDLLGRAQGRFYNSDWAQVFGRTVGLTSQKVSTLVTQPSIQARLADIDRRYQAKLQSLNMKLTEAVIMSEDWADIQREIADVQIQMQAEQRYLLEMTR